MPRLLSINVGRPRDIEWNGRTVRTAIWKTPVSGGCRVGRLNLDGDAQGDLAGHGGEQRAVFVYQIESYRYWQAQLKRPGFVYGQFGENFTVDEMPDDVVCVGDRYQIGSALFEVTQPRVTCYRVGIRLDEPRMAALLTSSGRPGFYFRVLQEGEVEAGDEIIQLDTPGERMTVAEINALLYSPHHPRDRLERALQITALSPGWRGSFEAMLHSADGGNAGLAPQAAAHPAAPGFHPLTVTAIDRESADVLSLTLQNPDEQPLPMPLPGQYVVLRLQSPADNRPLFRSYSLSGTPSTKLYRISVKIEPNGAAGAYLHKHVHLGDTLAVSAPRGSFTLQPGERPVVLLSAGIGITPTLAMLHALAAAGSRQQIFWIHAARNGEHHPFVTEVGRLLSALTQARSYVCYSSPNAHDKLGKDFDAPGHLSLAFFKEIGIPTQADVYVCGPDRFMADMKQILTTVGIPTDHIHAEAFSGGESMTPGVVGKPPSAPHLPKADDTSAGPLISFARSGIAAHWNAAAYASILELAEACDVPVRWSCRTGVCHNCESGLISGAVSYHPDPLETPAEGNLLLCCSQPEGDLVIDI